MSRRVIGYIVVHDIDPNTGGGELGFALLSEHWGLGLIVECSKAVIERLKMDGFKYILATHDVNNYQSGRALEKIRMGYKYSYIEDWMPKNIKVTFRMYQLNLDGVEKTSIDY